MFDNKYENVCPACGEKMVKVYMPNQKVNLDVCLNGCGGIYFDNREFEKFDEVHEDIAPLLEAYKGKTFKKVDESQTRICPVCGMQMVKNFSSAKKEVQIDECYRCGGRFLDYSELEKIRAEYPNENARADAAIELLYKEAGSELAVFRAQYGRYKKNPSMLTRLHDLFYGN